MNRIQKTFNKLQRSNAKALIPYITCGDPDIAFTEELVTVLVEKGADIIELGVPYSDPVADGPTIQKASVRALENGIKLDHIFEMVSRVRSKVDVPLVIMTYNNPVYVTGIDVFLDKAYSAGVDGLIIPDIPLEEGEQLQEGANKRNINLISMVAPTTTGKRLEKIVQLAEGFIYCVSVSGVTGARQILPHNLKNMVASLKALTSVPIAVGFGISGPEMAKKVSQYADGIVVGSALIQKIEKHIEQDKPHYQKALNEAGEFIQLIKQALG